MSCPRFTNAVSHRGVEQRETGDASVRLKGKASGIAAMRSFRDSKPSLPIMPAGPDETDNHPVGAVTEHVAKTASSKTESNASTHPLHQQEPPKGDKVEFIYSSGKPGPAESDKLAVMISLSIQNVKWAGW
ncbi:uncharacterized protein L3040_000113 [Drepanopeziza brunnea f. sp. 'multigermtubi']|uniref:uncharacterized protein n=1 Tax=Drepanopeziza brunnea f. sp. 'multigermtubi' TaxID=698441 RepID=UPI0023A513CE|nr:hypothetical protein L3040_000113 [Drepanopeziza brunnea f. sp. 'multigermtubi']